MSFISAPAGLTGLVSGTNNTAPNAAIPVSFLQTTSILANADFALTPKGTGSILAAVPDATAVGGNKRGTNAVDLQTVRGAAANVASGLQSVLVGGNSNQVSGNLGGIVGGQSNIVSNRGFIGGGFTNTASGNDAGILCGNNCLASGQYSQAGGQFATTRGISGMVAYSSGNFATLGDMQRGSYGVSKHTNNAVAQTLTSDQAAAAAANQVTLPDNARYHFKATVVGFATATGDHTVITFEGVGIRNAGVGTMSIAGLVTTNINTSAGAAAWVVACVADVAFGAIQFNVTGAAAVQINWTARIETTECTA